MKRRFAYRLFMAVLCLAIFFSNSTHAQEIDDPEVAAVVDVAKNLLNDARASLLKAKRAIDRSNLSISEARRSRSSLIARENELNDERKVKLDEYNEAASKSDSAKYQNSVIGNLLNIYSRTLNQYSYIAAGSCLPIQGFEGLCIEVPWDSRKEILRELARINESISLVAEDNSISSDDALRDVSASLHTDLSSLPFGLPRYVATTKNLLDSYKKGLQRTSALYNSTSSITAPCGSSVNVSSFGADIEFIFNLVANSTEYNWNIEFASILERYASEFLIWKTCRVERARVLDAVNDKIKAARKKRDSVQEEQADRERLSLVGEIWGIDRDLEVLDLRERVFTAIKNSLSTLPLNVSKVAGLVYLGSIKEGLTNSSLIVTGNADSISEASSIISILDAIKDESRIVVLSKLATLRTYTTSRYGTEIHYIGATFFADMGEALRTSLNETQWSSERYRQLLTKALGRLGDEKGEIASISSLEATAESLRVSLVSAGDAYRVQLNRRLAVDDQISRVIERRNNLGRLITRAKIQEIYKSVLRDFIQRLALHPGYPNLQPELDKNLSLLTRVFSSSIKIPNVQKISPRTGIVRQALLARRRIARVMTKTVNQLSIRLIGSQMTDLIKALNEEKRVLDRSFPVL